MFTMTDRHKRPCHRCGEHFTECKCDRRSAKLYYKVGCPNCSNAFRVAAPTKSEWIQRCSHCLQAFNVKAEVGRSTPSDEAAQPLGKFEIDDLFLHWWKSQSLTSEPERSKAVARVAYEAGMVEARRQGEEGRGDG